MCSTSPREAAGGDEESENTEGAPGSPSCFTQMANFAQDWGSVAASMVVLLLAVGTALTAGKKLVAGVAYFWWKALGLGMGPYCYLSVASQVVYFGDMADYLALGTFTVMDTLPLASMMLLTCGAQGVFSCWCSVLYIGYCFAGCFQGIVWLVESIVWLVESIVMSIVHLFVHLFVNLWHTLVWLFHCQCWYALWQYIKDIICCLWQCIKGIICCPCHCISFAWQCLGCLCWECGFWLHHCSCKCCCSCILSAPYISQLVSLAVLVLGIPMLVITAGYTIAGLAATVLMAVALVVFFSSLFIAVFWVLHCVLAALTFPLRYFGKGLEFRGPMIFARDYFAQLANTLMSKEAQEAMLQAVDPTHLKQSIKKYHGRAQQQKRALTRRASGAMAPLQQQMLGTVTLVVKGREKEVGRNETFHNSLGGQAGAFTKSIIWEGATLDPYKTPADYRFQGRVEISLENPAVFDPLAVFHPPPAEDVISKTTGKFDRKLFLMKYIQSVSKAWGGGMIIGPGLLLVFLFVVSAVPSSSQMLMVWVTGDISWKLCGRFSITKSACHSLTGAGTINGCKCLSCADAETISGAGSCGAIDQCGAKGNQHNCFGWHFEDFEFPAIDGNCSCSKSVLTYDPDTAPISTAQFFKYEKMITRISFAHPEVPMPVTLWHAEMAGFKASLAGMTSLLHFAFIDCLWAALMAPVKETKATYEFLKDKFYTMENLMGGVFGWIKGEADSFEQTQLGILLGRAAIALSVGIISALESIRV